jgi:hypothetical protein
VATALRWFSRYLDESKGVTLLSAQLALVALGSGRREFDPRAGPFSPATQS